MTDTALSAPAVYAPGEIAGEGAASLRAVHARLLDLLPPGRLRVYEAGGGSTSYLPAEIAAVYLAHFHQARDHDGLIPPIPGAMFGQTAATTAWMERQCNAQSLATFTWPALIGEAIRSIPRHYILAGNWQPSPFVAEHARYANAPGWTAETLAGGHCLMMDQPAELAAALARLA